MIDLLNKSPPGEWYWHIGFGLQRARLFSLLSLVLLLRLRSVCSGQSFQKVVWTEHYVVLLFVHFSDLVDCVSKFLVFKTNHSKTLLKIKAGSPTRSTLTRHATKVPDMLALRKWSVQQQSNSLSDDRNLPQQQSNLCECLQQIRMCSSEKKNGSRV